MMTSSSEAAAERGARPSAASVLARVAALKTTPTPELKQQWRELFGKEPPPFNRRYLESRLAYRIQELAYGGLKPETRWSGCGHWASSSTAATSRLRRTRVDDRPIAGTRLIREWQGVEHCVTVLRRRLRVAGPALQEPVRGRPRHHRHAVERLDLLRPEERPGRAAVSSGPSPTRRSPLGPQAALRGLHPEVQRGRAGAGVQLPRCPARGLRGLRRQPAAGGLGAGAGPLRRRRRLGRHAGAAGPEAAPRRHRGGLVDVVVVYKIDRLSPLADGLRQAGRPVRGARGHVRLRDPELQHHDQHGAADAQRPAVLRPVRAGGDRGADPGQVRRLAAPAACGWAAGRRSATTSRTASSW